MLIGLMAVQGHCGRQMLPIQRLLPRDIARR
jgi:hypothetical protein